MKPFQYCIVWHPTEQERKDGKRDELVANVETVLAADQNSALMLAARAIPERYESYLSQVEIIIRPF